METWPQVRRLGLLLRRNWKLWCLATFIYHWGEALVVSAETRGEKTSK